MNVLSPDFHDPVILTIESSHMRRGAIVVAVVLLAWGLRAYGRGPAPQVVHVPDAPAASTPEARGRAVYETYGCRLCHGADGKGGFANPNALSDGKVRGVTTVAEEFTAAEIRQVIAAGQPRIARADEKGPVPPFRMPGWAGQMTDQQINDLTKYLMSLQPKSADKSWR